MSDENSQIHVENHEKNIRHKDNIIDQVLEDLLKISTQSTRHPQVELSVGYQELASMQYSINPPKCSEKNLPDAEPKNTETRSTIPPKKSHIDLISFKSVPCYYTQR